MKSLLYKIHTVLLYIVFLNIYVHGIAQVEVQISDIGSNNSIGEANSSRNTAVNSNGDIYVVFSGSEGIRVAKSTNNGVLFNSSVQVVANAVGVSFPKPEIAVNEFGDVFVVWITTNNSGSFSAGDILFSKSTNGGNSFSAPVSIARTIASATIHMATRENTVVIRDNFGRFVYYNNTRGDGAFSTYDIAANFTIPGGLFTSSDVFIDTTGIVYLIADAPELRLYKSTDNAQTFSEVILSPAASRLLYLSSYALTESPSGTFIFGAGGSFTGSDERIGYRINVATGNTITTNFALMTVDDARTLYADEYGTLIDGFIDGGGIQMNVSYDQGITYDEFISIDPTAVSHSIDTNPTTGDITVVYERAGQVYMKVYPGFIRNIRITSPVANPLLTCQGDTFNLNYTVSGPFPFITNPEFALYLSDANGNFDLTDPSQKINSQVITSTGNYSFTVTVPNTISTSPNYQLKIQSGTTQSNVLLADIGVDISVAATPNTISECDNGSGQATFDFSSNSSIITGTTGGVISYHLSEADARADMAAIPNVYTSTSDRIWARLETPTSARCENFDITFFDIIVVSPNFIQASTNISTLEYCDNETVGSDSDNRVIFDLTQKEQDVLTAGNNRTDYTYDYFTDSTLTTKIDNPAAFQNTSTPQTIYVAVTQKAAPNCTYDTNFQIEVSPNPISFSDEIDKATCDDNNDGISTFDLTEVQLDLASVAPLANYSYTYYESFQAAASNTNIITNPSSFTNTRIGAQDVYVRLQDRLDPNCFKIVTINLNVNRAPVLELSDQYVLCLNTDGTSFVSDESILLSPLPLNTGLDRFNFQFEWYRGQTVTIGSLITDATIGIYAPEEAGFYTVNTIDAVTGCNTIKTVEVVASSRPDEIAIEILANGFANDNAFRVTVTGNGSYEYSLDGINWQSSNTFTGVKGGESTVFTRDIYNCAAIFDVTRFLDFPKAFTPNGDGINDSWNIEAVDGRTVFNTTIFDRNGRLLKQIDSKSNGWDGTVFGNAVPTGQYWFVIDYSDAADGIRKQFKASFTLKR